MKLSDFEADSQLDVPRDAGRALKALAAGEANAAQQRMAYRFFVDVLGAKDKLTFRPLVGVDLPLTMAWFEGRRFVAVQAERIVAAPMDDPEPAEPPARTITERAERRRRKAQQPEG